MPVTYKKIASVTVGAGGASSVELTSIPGTYTDLKLSFSTRITATNIFYVDVQPNGLTTNRSARFLVGSGSAASSSNTTTIEAATVPNDATSSTFGNADIYIPNYSGSTNKSFSIDSVGENNGTLAYMFMVAGLWSQTTAITSLKLVPGSGNFAQYSTATLYGISKG